MIQHSKLSASGRRWLRSIAGGFCSLILAVSVATAGVGDPLIDGNGQDIINLAANIGSAGCGLDVADARDDISISDAGIVPCARLEITNGGLNPDYYVNGKDLRRFVTVYRRGDKALFLLFRAEGFIGDVDGNGNPDNALCDQSAVPEAPPAASFIDQVGIGTEESYEAFIDTDCDPNGGSEFTIVVKGEQVTVNGVVDPTATIAYRQNAGSGATGQDLEVRINGLTLPAGFKIFGFSGAIRDGLGEDVTRESACTVNPNISLDKSVNVASICPGGSADFTLVVTNTGDVNLANVTVVDNLPAGLVYQQTASNTCGGPVSPVGNTITYGPFDLEAGASCTIVIRVGRTAECSGEQVNTASVEGTFQSACFNGGVATIVSANDSATILCGSITCSIDAPDRRVCGTETVQICGPEGNYGYLWSTGATTRCINVGAGPYSLTITDNATGCQSTNPCAVTIEADTPVIEVTKSVSPEGAVEQGTLLTYTLTVTNPAWSTITAQSILVTDYMCDESVYAGNANPAPTSAPAVGETGTLVWTVGPLAPGTSATITFDARIRELEAPACESTERLCENRVEVSTSCGGGTPATDEASVRTPITPCLQQGLCRLTGGGCLNEDGDNRGHKQSTFGGNSSPFHEGGGPTGNSWEHVYRDGKTILFNWHSWDAYVTRCTVVGSGPCHPQAENTKAEFQGTGKYSLGAGSRDQAGNMVAYIIDHREGACNRNDRDEYSITVREGLIIGQGDIVFQTSGEIDCGNLQIHETPRWLFSGGTQQPGTLNEVESVALLNRAVPNPFKASMSYAYEITGGDQPVEIAVYNVAGRMVKSLVSSTMPAGRHTATWNGADDAGSRAPSGVYFVRARYGAEMKQQRVIYLGQ